MVVQTTLHY